MSLRPAYEVRLVEKPTRHYEVTCRDGSVHRFPGVTTILGMVGGDKMQALIGWAKKQALSRVEEELRAKLGKSPKALIAIDEEWIKGLISQAKKKPQQQLASAADYGTRAHAAIDAIIHGREPDITDDIRPVVDGFLKWQTESGIKIVAGDTKVASLLGGFAGSLDAWGTRGKKRVILDWKTSNAIRVLEYSAQVAAYDQGFYETYGVPFDEAYIIRFGKETPEFEPHQVTDIHGYFRAFQAAKLLWDRAQAEAANV